MCKLDVELAKELEDSLRRAFQRVFGDNLVSLVLFGSYARGDPSCDSDLDVLVVVDEVGDRWELHKLLDMVEKDLELVLNKLRLRGFQPVLSPIVLARDQARRFRPLYIDLVFDARIIYDREGFMEKVLSSIRERLESLGARRHRIGRLWVVIVKDKVEPGEVFEIGE
jgi:predicted nucleotidyltransferase